MRISFVILLLICGTPAVAQEAMINDILRCGRTYFIQKDLVRQIKKEKDTINYYYDEELIIYYNQKKTKQLEANTFYVINHGYNKLITLNLRFFMAEYADGKHKRDTLISNPYQYMKIYQEDSLQRGSYGTFAIQTNNYLNKNWTITSYYIEIRYFGKVIRRWFMRQADIRSLFPAQGNMIMAP